MSDSSSGNTGGSPYGEPQPGQNPYGEPSAPPPSPYGEQPPQPAPYGEQPAQPSPYGEQPAPPGPYGQPVQQNPYGQPAQQNPYGQPAQPSPYGQQPPPAQPAYGYGGPTSDKRPGSVTAASVITLIFSGLSVLLYAFGLIALVLARDDVLNEMTRQPEFEDAGISADAAFGFFVAVLAVFLVWCLVACVLALLVLRRSNAARITLVVSSSVAALFSLLSITSLVSAIPLLAAIAVIVLLFVGGANEWFKSKGRQPAIPGMTQY